MGLWSAFEYQFLKGKCSFGSHFDDSQEIEYFFLEEGNLLAEILSGVVTNLSDNISEFIVELILLPEEEFFDFPVRFVVIND